MTEKRLNLCIDGDVRDALQDIAKRKGKTLKATAEEYLRLGIARDQGKLVEEESLPAIREAVAAEVNRAVARLYKDLVDSLAGEIKLHERKGDDRLAAMIAKSIRNAGIGRRLTYTLIAKQISTDFAMKAFEDAKQKSGRDLDAHTNIDMP